MGRGSWPRYVALGDSLTAGRDDLGPGGVRIGWARRLAGLLGERTGVACTLTNLAKDGASVEVVLARQLPVLVGLGAEGHVMSERRHGAEVGGGSGERGGSGELGEGRWPDLVSVTVGMNDIRDRGFEPGRFAAGVGALLDGLAATGATVLTCTLPDMAGILPVPAGLVEVARQRLRQASDVIREQAAGRDAVCLDVWAMAEAADLALFGPDRIHPNASGHQLIADAFAALLLTDDAPVTRP